MDSLEQAAFGKSIMTMIGSICLFLFVAVSGFLCLQDFVTRLLHSIR